MKIEDIMSKDLVVGDIDDTISDIANLMREFDVGFIPIAEEKKIIGVVTDRDIIINAIDNDADLETEIEKYITRNIISINKDESLESAINLMGQEKIKRLLVSDDNKLVGIISITDIINADIDNNLIVNNFKKIWSVSRNIDEYQTEIDEFYL